MNQIIIIPHHFGTNNTKVIDQLFVAQSRKTGPLDRLVGRPRFFTPGNHFHLVECSSGFSTLIFSLFATANNLSSDETNTKSPGAT
jgi:hypothetical protein